MGEALPDPFIIYKKEKIEEFQRVLPRIKLRKPTKDSWTSLQNKQYVTFLKENLEVMESKTLRKEQKVFSLMAKQIKTRSSTQIKSHHQKLIRKYGKIKAVISKVSQFLSITSQISFKDAQTLTDSRFQCQQVYHNQIVQSKSQVDFDEQFPSRSGVQEIFFQSQSQISLIFDGIEVHYHDEPLI